MSQQGVEAGLADDLEHGGDVVRRRGRCGGETKSGSAGGGGVGGHERLLDAGGALRDAEADSPPHLSPEIGSRVPARAVLAPERFRGGLPLRRPGRSPRATGRGRGGGARGLSRTGSISTASLTSRGREAAPRAGAAAPVRRRRVGRAGRR